MKNRLASIPTNNNPFFNPIFRKIICRSIILLIIPSFLYSQLRQANIQLLGGGKRVSGSAYYFKTDQKNFLVDCGLFYPETKNIKYEKDINNTNRLNSKLPISPQKISAILITHAHLDHIGKIPLFVKNGFNGRIYSTEPTKKLSLIMFEMMLKSTSFGSEIFTKSNKSNKLHTQSTCEWKNRIKRPKTIKLERNELQDSGLQICKVCLGIELKNIARLFKTNKYNRTFDISKDISIEYFDAKHIPGSASILVKLNLVSGKKLIHITGDLGSGLDNILKGKPKVPKVVDYIFIESTYGGKSRVLSNNPFNEFFSDLNTSISNDHVIWIPSFVMDRTQKVLNVIKKGQKNKRLPKNINIKVVSSTAKKVNKVYDQYFDFRPNSVDESFSMSPTKLSSEIKGPIVLITPSYIDQLDFFHPIVEKIIRSKDSDLMLVGYQDPRSFGGLLKDISTGSKVSLGGKKIKVSASTKYYSGIFSGHLDSNGIKNYLKSTKINEDIMLVHGDISSLNSLKSNLKPFFKNDLIVPGENWLLEIK